MAGTRLCIILVTMIEIVILLGIAFWLTIPSPLTSSSHVVDECYNDNNHYPLYPYQHPFWALWDFIIKTIDVPQQPSQPKRNDNITLPFQRNFLKDYAFGYYFPIVFPLVLPPLLTFIREIKRYRSKNKEKRKKQHIVQQS